MIPRDHSETVEATREVASRIAGSMGLEVVELVFHGTGGRWLLRLHIDRAGPVGVGIEDCQRVSRALGEALDDADLIDHSYTLEVSSPGIDRPIRTPDDIRRNTGRRVVMETSESVLGRRRFRGVLLAAEGEDLRLREDDGAEVLVPGRRVVRAQQDSAF